jgi:farnesyl diphosphate synthase
MMLDPETITSISITGLQTRFQDYITNYVSTLDSHSDNLLKAIKYTALSDGKRLRPLLVYTTGLLLGCDIDKLDAPALAVELLHTYSLVHDDLPAMDDDNLRRGKPSCHIAFDEATAILVGDVLQSLSIELLLTSTRLTTEQKQKMTLSLLRASGIQGMVAGQALDLTLLVQDEISEKNLDRVHALKTGELFNACILLALNAKDISPDSTIFKDLSLFSSNLGIAFQIQDDYLDRYGKTETLGKTQGSDQKQGKTTYTHFYDEPSLKALINTRYQNALDALSPYKDNATLLIELTLLLKNRNH